MSESVTLAAELEMKIMQYVVRDEETDEITGIADNAPDDIKVAFKDYMQSLEDTEPIVR